MRRLAGSVLLLGTLAASLVVMLVAAVTASTSAAYVFAFAAAVGYPVEWTIRRRRRLDLALSRARVSVGVRYAVRDALLLVFALRSGAPSSVVAALVGWIMLEYAARTGYLKLGRVCDERRRLGFEWRNIEVPGLAIPDPPPDLIRRNGSRKILSAGMLPVAATIAWVLGADPALVWAGAACAAAIVLLLVGGMLVELGVTARHPDPEEVREQVAAVMIAYDPQVVIYLSGQRSSTFALNQWLPTLEKTTPRSMVIVRERAHLKATTEQLPVLYLPKAVDLERFVLPSLKVALYPMNGMRNNHLVRFPGIADIFVGHGDSDKGSSVNPISRMYDEVWVAGQAGRDRYRAAQVGVRDEQVREVGRPQLAEIDVVGAESDGQETADRPFTVLYAPTWEGFYAALGYSSLLSMGVGIVRTLLGISGVRVLFKPHPGTGIRDGEYTTACREVERMVEAAGNGSAVVEGDLYDAFNTADLLITDISSVVSDFLYSRKPYIVSNPHGEDHVGFRAEYPSTGGAYLLDPDCAALGEYLVDARGADSLRADRERTARYLLGEHTDDPIAVFDRALLDLVARWAAKTEPAAEPTAVGSTAAGSTDRPATATPA